MFSLVRSGLALNLGKLARAQEQVATGKRILRPSDDAVGTSAALAVRRQLGGVESYRSAMTTARPLLASGASQLQSGSGLMSEARALIVQGMNGTLSPEDREVLAGQIELVYESLLEIANSRSGERYLFSGTLTSTPPFRETADGRVEYGGNNSEQAILIGRGVELDVNVAGDQIFDRFEYSGVNFTGLTGVKAGQSANSGSGYHEVHVRHDATTGIPTGGIALAGGGAQDTIMGDHTVTVDGAAGTIRLDGGKNLPIPSPLPAALEVQSDDGSKVVLDLSGWGGSDESFVLRGSGSIALNDGAYQPISLAETDLQLIDAGRDAVLHIDTTQVTRAAPELVRFSGAANVFDTLRGVASDLRNDNGLTAPENLSRIKQRLEEFDRNHENLLIGMGQLGSRTQRLDTTESRLGDLSVHLESLISSFEDADLTDVVLDMTRAEQTLQLAQGTGARLINQSLLSFLR
ncbi:MAG: flagellar hook-associated protein FlgL [Planctomycetota bacterium]|nr:flagellar hook-associated protein FlgL [Planctomycetota bacterium]